MVPNRPRKILVTSALPYANAPLHLGHMLEQVQADIWVRFQKSRGHDCLYVCADDAHGTAIMLAAEKQGITPEQHIENIHRDHKRDSERFLIDFANFIQKHGAMRTASIEAAPVVFDRTGEGTLLVAEQLRFNQSRRVLRQVQRRKGTGKTLNKGA